MRHEDSMTLKEILIAIEAIIKRSKAVFFYGFLFAVALSVFIHYWAKEYKTSFSIETQIVYHETVTQILSSFSESITHKQFKALSKECGCDEAVLATVKELIVEPPVVRPLPEQGAWINLIMVLRKPQHAKIISECVKQYVNNNPMVIKQLADFRKLQTDFLESIEPEINELNRQQEVIAEMLEKGGPQGANIFLNSSHSEMSSLLNAKQQAIKMLDMAVSIEVIKHPTEPTVPTRSLFKSAAISFLITAFLGTLFIVFREVRLYIRS